MKILIEAKQYKKRMYIYLTELWNAQSRSKPNLKEIDESGNTMESLNIFLL